MRKTRTLPLSLSSLCLALVSIPFLACDLLPKGQVNDETPDAGNEVDAGTGAGVATFYRHCDYGGWAIALDVGSYTTAELADMGIPDNSVSSVKVAAGYQVVLYDGRDPEGGNAVTVTADDPCLVDDSFNDKTSSIVVSVAAVPSSPAAPAGLTASANSSSQIALSWADNSTNEASFRVEESADGTTFASKTTTEANVTSASISGLAAGTRYYYRVRAESSAGNSRYSNTANAQTTAGGFFTLTATAGPNGSISPSGTVTVDAGQDRTFTMTPASNHVVASVKVDGAEVGPVLSYTFDNVQAAHTIAVIFSSNPRDGLVYGTYKPDATTTGPLPGTVFTQWGDSSTTTNFVVTQDSQIVENLEIWGKVMLNGRRNVVVRNCIIHGSLDRIPAQSNVQGFGSQEDLGGALIIDTQFVGRPMTVPVTYKGVVMPDAGNVNLGNEWCAGLRGGNYTIRRCEFINQSDGIGLTSQLGNVTIEGNWIHDGWYNEWPASQASASDANAETAKYYPYSTGTVNYTHVDGVQFHRGMHYRIVGNWIGGTRVPGTIHATPSDKDLINTGDDMYTSAFMIQQEVNDDDINHLGDVLIDRNWLVGGAATINMVYKNNNRLDTVTLSNNKFTRSTWGTHLYINRWNDPEGVPMANFSNNVFEDDNSAVPIRVGGTGSYTP